MENKYLKLRILFVGSIFFIFFLVIASRAVYLQVYLSKWLSQKASSQYEKSLTTAGKRGNILDRNRKEMAVSIDVTSIAAYPARIENPKAAAKALAGPLKLNARKIHRKLVSKKSFVWIKRQTTAKETRAIKKLEIPGIDFVSEYNRYYPHTTLAAQALGFTGVDGAGLEGIEYYYNQILEGAHRNFTVIQDALGSGFTTESRPGGKSQRA